MNFKVRNTLILLMSQKEYKSIILFRDFLTKIDFDNVFLPIFFMKVGISW